MRKMNRDMDEKRLVLITLKLWHTIKYLFNIFYYMHYIIYLFYILLHMFEIFHKKIFKKNLNGGSRLYKRMLVGLFYQVAVWPLETHFLSCILVLLKNNNYHCHSVYGLLHGPITWTKWHLHVREFRNV